MLTAAIAITTAAACALLGWATFHLIRDARERKYEAEMDDRYVAHRRSVNSRYLRDDESRPE